MALRAEIRPVDPKILDVVGLTFSGCILHHLQVSRQWPWRNEVYHTAPSVHETVDNCFLITRQAVHPLAG